MSDVFVFGASNFLEVFFILLIFIPLLLFWVFALVDLFGRRDIGGGAKALWLFVIIVIPVLGALIYFLVRPAPAEEVERTARREGV